MNRQAATAKGLARRIEDLGLGRVRDPRKQRRGVEPLATLLGALLSAMVSGARSLRAAEQRTEQMARKDRWHSITERIADNTLGAIVRRLEPDELVACMHGLIKAEHRRGNLDATRLSLGTVAIDGKNTATLRWHELCRSLGPFPLGGFATQRERSSPCSVSLRWPCSRSPGG